jgi:hypothetical protein
MLRFASPVTLNLSRGELLSWQQGRVQLRVVSGTAWVTRPNDLDDHFLKPGQTLELGEGLIGAESDLCLCIEAAQAGRARAVHPLAAAFGWLRPAQAELSLR